MKEHKIQIENYLSIEQMNIDLKGVKGFVGENAQGKTNILKALKEILTGAHDALKIKDGQTRAMIKLEELTDGEVTTSVQKVITEKGARIDAKGLPYGYTPKTYIERLIDEYAVNPLQLIGNNIVEYLKEQLPAKIDESDLQGYEIPEKLDFSKNAFSELERLAKYTGTVRTETGKDLKHEEEILKELNKSVTSIIISEISPEKLDETKKKIQEIEFKKQENENRQEEIRKEKQNTENSLRITKNEISDMEGFIISLKAKIRDTEIQIDKTQEKIAMLNQKYCELTLVRDKIIEKEHQFAPIDVSEINILKSQYENEKLQLAQKIQQEQVNSQIKERQGKIENVKTKYSNLDKTFKYFSYELPKKLIERCKLPVEGLSFQDGQLFVQDRRIDLLSETERTLVAARLGIALAKQKGHIAVCLDGIEQMDLNHREIFLKEAEASGLAVLYTRVGKPEYSHEIEIKKLKA